MKGIEDKIHKQSPRKYLGVSQLGTKCDRWLWYDFRLATKLTPITQREYRLFNRGHWEELIVANELIKSGAKVSGLTIDQSIIDVFKTVFGIDLPEINQEKVTFCHDHGQGHCDGIVDGDTALFVSKDELIFENKTSNNRGFSALKNSLDLQKSKYEHFCQCQGYMHLFNKKRCLYVITRKENDERVYLYIDYDKKFSERMFKRADKIILSPIAPDRIGDRNYYMCRQYTCKITGDLKYFCPHREVCHNDARYQKTCRTCKNVEIHDKGRWHCKSKNKFLSFKKQLKACKKYKVL